MTDCRSRTGMASVSGVAVKGKTDSDVFDQNITLHKIHREFSKRVLEM